MPPAEPVPPAPAEAAAQPSAAQPPAAKEPAEWTGWQTLAIDVAGLAIGLGVASSTDGAASDIGIVAGTWYGVSLVGAPAVHYVNKHWPTGLADFGLRALVPALMGVGGLFVECLDSDLDDSCADKGFAVGTLIGLGGAAAFDAFVLSSANAHDAPRTRGEWYGVQILVVDLIAYGIGAYLAIKDPKEGHDRPHPGLSLWVMDYIIGTIGAPIVHFAHSNIGLGFASIGARLLLSPIGAVLGIIGACGPTAGSHNCTEEGAQWGLLGGSVAIVLLDALVFAREEVPETAAASASPVDVTIGAGSLGLRGRW
jgi:hypothetical protein